MGSRWENWCHVGGDGWQDYESGYGCVRIIEGKRWWKLGGGIREFN